MKMKKILWILLTAALITLTSCNDIIGNSDGIKPFEKAASVIVTVEDGKLNRRSAMPSVPEFTYIITASKGEETLAPVTEPVEGSERDFQLMLTPGTWQIEAVAVKAGTSGVEVLKGTNSVTVAQNGQYSVTVPITYLTQGNGSVNLLMNVDPIVECVKFEINGSEKIFTAQNNKININLSDIPSDNYDVALRFFGQNDLFLCSINEVFNVRPNLVTDSWIDTGIGTYIKKNQAEQVEFCITKQNIIDLIDHTYYVKSEGDDDNIGNSSSPVKTVNEVLDRIRLLGDNSENAYTVHVLSDITLQSDLDLDGMYVVLTADDAYRLSGSAVHVYDGTTLILSKNILLDSVTVHADGAVHLKNITGTQNIASLNCEEPELNDVVLVCDDDNGMTESIISRFTINPGYYLEASADGSNALIKESGISFTVDVLTGQYIINITGLTRQTAANGYLKSIRKGSKLTVTRIDAMSSMSKSFLDDSTSLELWCDDELVQVSDSDDNKSITVGEDLLPGNYVLKVSFIDSGLQIYQSLIIEVTDQ